MGFGESGNGSSRVARFLVEKGSRVEVVVTFKYQHHGHNA